MHEVRLRFDYASAELRVRRTVHNGGQRHDQATFMLDVPATAVAVGLRTLGELQGKPRWFAGDLLEAELAAARYQELTGIGGYYPKDPALLSWRSEAQLALQVFPVAPNAPKTVEYTLAMPVTYADGRYAIELPEMGLDGRPAEVALHPAHRLDQLFVDGSPVGRGTVVSADMWRRIELARRDPPLFDARLAVAATGKQSVVQYQLALGSRVSEVPRDASVVVVLDSSRSLGASEVEAEVAAARAYLRHFDGKRARVEVVTFDRRVRRRHGKLVSVEAALADLKRLDPDARKNGSAVDDALAEAAAILAREPARHARRIVLMTDTRTRRELTPRRLEAIARRSGAIVHFGTIGFGEPELQRDDAHVWAEAARATGGVAWLASADADPDSADAMRQTYLEWARPVRLDDAELVADDGFGALVDLPTSLPEGFGTELLDVRADGLDAVILTGELWSREVRNVATPDAAHAELWSALMFGSDELDRIDEDEMLVLAMRGGAVSPVTSYLAIEPGVRPSTEGLDWSGVGSGGGGMGEGTIGLGSVGTIGHGGGTRIDPREFLETQLRTAADACAVPTSVALHLQLQATLQEIVAVDSIELVGSTDTVAKACVEDGIWAVELPTVFAAQFEVWTVEA
jgi:hypothetical protein